MYYDRWEEMLGGAYQGTVEILRSLRNNAKYKVYALTNWSAETFPTAKKHFEFLNWFEGVVVSGEEKTRKPNPDIYEILLKRYQIEPQKSVFMDDSLPNVEEARNHKIHSIHFLSAIQLKEDLKKLGVEVL